ncbi:MAG: sensor histidine kinase [Spirochaetales bacterium]|nr:sensor histidine kinase [Spirochaetales bacterium]
MNKNKFLLYLHVVCSLFFFIREILLGENLTPVTILCSIVYFIIILLPAVFSSTIVKIVLYGVQLCGIVFASIFIPEILVLMPLHITRIIALFSLSPVIEFCILAIPVFFVAREYMFFSLVSSFLVFFVYKIIAEYDKSALMREQRIDKLESDNQILSRKISRLMELDREKELLIKLEERNRIARNLHDELGHTITGSIVQLEAVNTIIRDEPEKAERMIGTIASVLNKGMNSIRRGLKTLKPDSLQIGMHQVKQLLGNFERRTGIATQVKTGGSLSGISSNHWQVVLMNLKEALTNMLKHGKGTEVVVDINVFNKIIKVGIKDNGRGCESIRPGMGIMGMEERTKEAGGTLILDGSDGFAIIMIFKKGDEHGDPGINSR